MCKRNGYNLQQFKNLQYLHLHSYQIWVINLMWYRSLINLYRFQRNVCSKLYCYIYLSTHLDSFIHENLNEMFNSLHLYVFQKLDHQKMDIVNVINMYHNLFSRNLNSFDLKDKYYNPFERISWMSNQLFLHHYL